MWSTKMKSQTKFFCLKPSTCIHIAIVIALLIAFIWQVYDQVQKYLGKNGCHFMRFLEDDWIEKL